MKNIFVKLFITTMIIFNSLYINATEKNISEIEKEGDRLVSQKRYGEAIKKYWEAASMGSKTALPKISPYYNSWKIKSFYDWDIPRRYLQETADAQYKNTGKSPKEYNGGGRIFIIADEYTIIQKLGIDTISQKYWWGGNKRCENAVKKLYKNLYFDGKKGRIFMRSYELEYKVKKEYIKREVAILDRKTAVENFGELIRDNIKDDWSVFITSPSNPNKLIPFDNFHRTVYKEKILAFHEICRLLGAERVKVIYSNMNKDKKGAEVDVSAGFMSADVKVHAGLQKEYSAQEVILIAMKFSGSNDIHKPTSPWIAREGWDGLIKARYNRHNPAQEHTAEFHYTEYDYINFALKMALKSKLGVSLSGKAESEDFSNISWVFHVVFPKPNPFLGVTLLGEKKLNCNHENQ